jgi:hypothetical protein
MFTSLSPKSSQSPYRILRADAPRIARADLRLPHPSWRRTAEPSPADGAASIRSAGDFWSRLGL